MKAFWNDTEVANSDNTVIVEGNHYFALSSVNSDYLLGLCLIFNILRSIDRA